MRSIRKAPFLMMESCPSATNWKPINKLKKPGMLLAASLQAIAHGSDSVLYFQLRQSQGASEKFHGAVIDHYGGNDTRVFREVTEVGEALEKLQEVTGSVTCAKAAVLYDRENDWALKDAHRTKKRGYALSGVRSEAVQSFAGRRTVCGRDRPGAWHFLIIRSWQCRWRICSVRR